MFVQIVKWLSFSIIGIIGLIIFGFSIHTSFFYESEMNSIKEQLNNIKGVTVINIWGHEDITLEEVSARLRIKDKGEIVLYGLSKDSFHYPDYIPVTEIGGYSFTSFTCTGTLGIGQSLDIGRNSNVGKMINIEFKTVKDVIENYDKILSVIKSLKHSPELNHFKSHSFEEHLLIQKKSKPDSDPIFVLAGAENAFDFATTLKWENSACAD